MGSPSPASTFSQTGADITLTTYGNSIGTAPDQFAFAAQQITGTSWVMSCKINSWSSANAFSQAVLHARASLATNDAFVETFATPFSNGGGMYQAYRSASAGASTFTGPLAYPSSFTGPLWLFLNRNGNVFTSYYSLNGNTLVQIGQVTVTMGSTIYAGAGLCSNQTGLETTCDFTQVALQTLGNWTYTDTTVTPGTTYSYTATSQDGVPNVSAASAALSVTAASNVGIKWHPGHYTLNGTRPDVPGNYSSIQSQINQMAAVTKNSNGSGGSGFSGYLLSLSWYWLDMYGTAGPTDGQAGGGTGSSTQYNTIIIDTILGYLAAASSTYGKTFRLILNVNYDSYNNTPSSIPGVPLPVPYSAGSLSDTNLIVPQYILDPGVSGLAGGGGSPAATGDVFQVYSNASITAAFWRPAVTTAWNNLIKYLGQKYDGNPAVEMIFPFDQTGNQLYNPPSDFIGSAIQTAWQSIMSNATAYWPTTNKIFPNNFNSLNTTVAQLLASSVYAATLPAGFGGPDILSPSIGEGVSYGSQIEIGAGGIYGTIDYRGTIPMCYQQQQGAYISSASASDIEGYAYNTLQCTHTVWENDSGYAGAYLTWADVVNQLQSLAFRIHAQYPSNYP